MNEPKVVLRAWRIEKMARFDFELDDVALRALLDLFDQPLSPVERQAALLAVLTLGSEKPPRVEALLAHIEQAIVEAKEVSCR